MLSQLHIENFALIENLTIEFSKNLNVLTGETGAGKSILIDALSFVLGERSDLLRAIPGERAVLVEAVFELGEAFLKQSAQLETYLAEESLLILKREFREGKTRAWINGRLVTVALLKEVSAALIDIHGQYDHQLLLDQASHLSLLDRFAESETLKESYGVIFQEYSALLREKQELLENEKTKERELDLLKYQLGELERAELASLDEDALLNEKARLANVEKLSDLGSRILSLLEEQDGSASSLIGEASRHLTTLVRFDGSLETSRAEYVDLELKLEEFLRTMREYQESLTFDPERLAEVEKKLDLLELLKRKYGGSYSAVLEFYQEAKDKFEKLSNSEVTQKDLERKVKGLEPKLKVLSDELTQKRKKAAALLKRTVESELKDLNLSKACFEIQISAVPYEESGADKVEFLVSMNPGFPPEPLAKIISGGEASRVMLAMKRALMEIDPVPTLIFDEIDTNIGGRLGSVAGKKLKAISRERQVLLITHLPQIASFADRHFKVSKTVQKGKTSVSYLQLEGEARVRELAQMMSGQNESDISLKHAEEMLSQVR